MANESIIWKDIPGFEGLYKISEYGELKSFSRWRRTGTGGYYSKVKILKPRKDRKGYVTLQLTKRDKTYVYVKRSRMVASLFCDNPNNLPQVNHINGIKDDDHYTNLEWCTPRENELHAYRTGLKKAAYLGKYGKDHNQSKPVIAIKDTAILEFESKTECAIHLGTTVQNVYRSVKYDGFCKGYKIYSL